MGRNNNLTRGWTLQEKLRHYSRLNYVTGCFEWQGSVDTHGYGQLWWRGSNRLSHRLSWVVAKGPIPKDYSVCHRCDNPKCVNVTHMFLGTHAENMADKKAKGRAHRLAGEKNGLSKLTESDVRTIRTDSRAPRELASVFGVSKSLISHVKARRAWQHVP